MKQTLLLGIFIGLSGIASAQFWDYSEPVRIEGTVNSDAEENVPVFSNDSSILYFVRSFDAENKGGEMDQDIWFSYANESGQYVDCQRLKSLNNKFNNSLIGLSKDGLKMYVVNTYDGKKDLEKGVAVSEKNGDGWSKPQKLEIPGLDIEGDGYGFHISETEDVLIISHAGPGSLGEEDLYFSLKEGGNWSAPKHMGSTINTTGFEISPFLSPSMDTLFFSSNGLGGEGDADIFFAVKQGGWDEWSTPENLGNKINSPKFDAYFSYSNDQAFWSSNRESELSDIYRVQILTPPPLTVVCVANDATTYHGNDGWIEASTQGGAGSLKIEFSFEGGLREYMYDEPETPDHTGMKVSGLTKGEYVMTFTDKIGQTAVATCFVDEPAQPIAPVDVVEYENMDFMHNFAYNKNKLSTSRGDLKKFIKGIEKQLKDGREQVTINIISSASQVPTKSYGTNENLAKVRAENMKYDLVSHFEKKFKGKVNVVVLESKVGGPAYEDDASDKDKYGPYQFVSLKTE